ncbi:uncharacterized protein F5Z01DRAFT_174234 [Emericellopsis atlantica]|uniref:Rhodopsin domain-containing protein n=1 Tax=Emericellopsis atlantica TaxID=2614577 RepID=A0A9P8CMU9_9HYPO|nr:uncharacterized protein F5Z01DRAFT_174234 [Emericellopsis atlantica]KAG9253094.1 hypothetical protein F5Z01DRAFT_174234 [Emericellopsis atlantica]
MSVDHGVMYLSDPPFGVARDPSLPGQAAPLTIVTIVAFSLATVFMGIRVYSRQCIVGKLSFDDYVMGLAYACDAVMVGFTLNMLRYGMGKHIWNVPLTDLFPHFNLSNMVAAIFFCAATGFAKGSILLFYLRIFPAKAAHVAVWTAFAFTIAYSFTSVLVNIFACDPIKASWDFEAAKTAKCINRPVFYFAQAGLGIATDVITVLIPLPWLKSLKLPTRQKFYVAIMLTMGAFVCVISGIRLQSLKVLLNDPDLTRNTVLALMWCVLELNLSVIGGCIPTIKPLLKEFFPRLLGTSRSRSTTGGDIYLHSSRKTGRTTDNGHSAVRPFHAGLHSATGDTGSEEFIISKAYGSSMNGGVVEGKITRQYDIEVEVIKDNNRH